MKVICPVVLAAVICFAASAPAGTLYVSPNGTNNIAQNYPDWSGAANTVSAAVAKAVGGDTILVTNAVYTVTTYINIGTNITVIGTNGSGDGTWATINGAGAYLGVYLHHTGAVFSGFTISNCTYSSGGAVYQNGGTLRNCRIMANSASSANGGGVYVDPGTVQDCVIVSNYAYTHGGGLYVNNAVVERCTISLNNARYNNANYGGGIRANNSTIRDSTISGNNSYNGGGLRLEGAASVVSNCLIVSNGHSISGGGIYMTGGLVQNSTCSWNQAGINNFNGYGGGGIFISGGTVSNCLISDNVNNPNGGQSFPSSGGGGVYMNGSAARVLNCRILRNKSVTNEGSGNGGGMWISAGIVSNCLICSNGTGRVGGSPGGDGSGVYMVGGATVRDSTICHNYDNTGAGYGGGGVYMTTGLVLHCSINNNFKYCFGGGVYMSGGGAVVSDCTIQSNLMYLTDASLDPTYFKGGGVLGSAGAISNCVIQGNAARQGGGVYLSSAAILRNCLVVGNQSVLYGGGVKEDAGAIENCAIAGNSATTAGGGVYRDTGYSGTITNCIVYFNSSGGSTKDISGPSDTLFGYCCATSLTHGANGNITNVPQFINAGSGFGTNHVAGNYHLTAGSPCVNAGTNLPWMTGALDLDGRPRVRAGYGVNVDMGPYEFLPRGATFIMR